MRVNEIMISDYLSYEGQIIKVASITKKKVGYHIKDNEYRMHYARLCECEPVFITPEILEKLGFEKWDDGWYIYDYENTGIEIAWAGTILKINGEYVNLELPAVMYLHQLQHALRFCGISIKIEL
jgi:hypothetical protein